MRTLLIGMTALMLIAVVSAQTPAPRPAPPRPSPPSAPPRAAAVKPDADLAQLMRGILFPNSNLLFDVQQNDPGAPKKPAAASDGSATQSYANVYTGWQVVEGAAAALEESVDLLLKPGRVCSNGKPAPVARADYIKFAGSLRETARKAFIAAKAKNQEQVSDITNDLADACAMCHEVYRDKGPAASPARCAP